MAAQIVKDFDENMARCNHIIDFLKKLYYDPEFSTLFNRPVLSMLITAGVYLHDNLSALKVKYLSKP